MTEADHDAALNAARYLADDLPAEQRRIIETHIMSCDACWAEVVEARAGRALAESLREPAPQSSREMLRSIASGTPAATAPDPPQPRHRIRSAGGLRVAAALLLITVVAALTGVVTLLSDRQAADPLRAAAAEYQVASNGAEATGQPPATTRIGDLVWTETDHKTLGDQQATLYRYADQSGHRVVLISSTEAFPRADTAHDVGAGPEWIAGVGGATVLCVDADGLSWLVVAGSEAEALAAGAAVGFVT